MTGGRLENRWSTRHLPECEPITSWHGRFHTIHGWRCAPGCSIHPRRYDPVQSGRAAIRYWEGQYGPLGWTPWHTSTRRPPKTSA